MLRCMRPGCPTACGTRRKPSCVDRMLHYGLLVLLTAAFLISLGIGVISLGRVADQSGRVRESTPIAAPKVFELSSEAVDDGRKRIWSYRDGKAAFLTDAFVQVSQQR